MLISHYVCLPWYQKPHGSPSKRFWKVSLWSYIVRSAPTFLLSLPVRHKQALGMCSECCQCRSSINGRSFRHAPVTWALTFSVERLITDLVRVSPSYPTSFEMKLTCDSQIFRRHPMYFCYKEKSVVPCDSVGWSLVACFNFSARSLLLLGAARLWNAESIRNVTVVWNVSR